MSKTVPNYRKITGAIRDKGTRQTLDLRGLAWVGGKLVTWENCTISFMVRIFRQYYSGDLIKLGEMGGTCSTNRRRNFSREA